MTDRYSVSMISNGSNDEDGIVDRCCTDVFIDEVKGRTRDEHGFMGFTHALSAVAVMMALFAFAPTTFESVFKATSIPVLILLILVIAGGALMPDLDNTNSSAESSMGFIGSILSEAMRATAPIFKNLIHSKYDKDLDDPHRGFYHTAVCAVLMGGIAAFLCSPVMSIPIGDSLRIDGKAFALIFAFIAVNMSLSVLAKPLVKKMKSAAGLFGVVVPLILAAIVVAALFKLLPAGYDYTMIGIGYGVGWFIHCFGDCFTTAGCPVLAPLPIKGHMWYNIRFFKIKAGGFVENLVFVPVFVVVIVLSLARMLAIL